MKYFGWDYLKAGHKYTPYQIKRGVSITDFNQSQEDKKLASIIRMHQAESKDFKPWFESL